MAKKQVGVFIKPLVRKQMTQYFDGYGNGRDRKNYNKNLNVTKLQLIPNSFQNSVTYRGLVKSEYRRDPNNSTGNANKVKKAGTPKFIQYLVTVRFHDVPYKDQNTAQFDQEWKVGKDTKFSRRPAISGNPAMIKCQCRDFMLTWEKWLAEKGGLWPNNKWTKYTRKTQYNPQLPPHPIHNPPYRNPDEKMGYCKHIETFLQYLYDEDLIRNR